MPIPGSMSDLTVSAATNSPPGGEVTGTNVDDYMRGYAAILRRLNARGADINVVSGIVTPGDDGSYFLVGTSNTVTGIANSWVGREVTLVFREVLTIVHSSSLILPGGTNIVTTPLVPFRFVLENSNPVWRCIGTAVVPAVASGLLPVTTRQLFLTAGAFTWNRPTGCRAILVRQRAAGAGGGGTAFHGAGVCSCGAGGGEGEYVEALITSPGPSATVIVGARGIGGAPGSAGTPGGDTSFGGFLFAKGGLPGAPSSSSGNGPAIVSLGGAGGFTSPDSNVRRAGDCGGSGFILSGQALSGKGGGPGGGNPRFVTGGTFADGEAGRSPGGGGSGAATNANNPRTGGDGFQGMCSVEEHY